MKIFYDQPKQRLVFIQEKATSQFWDKLWQTDNLKEQLKQAGGEKLYTGITKHFLPAKPSTRIIEGGCGRGEIVYALQQAGYDVHGVDFAVETIKRTKNVMPNLSVTLGDVTSLDFPDNHFDGYWSLGVIEHSFSGYQPILCEMQRVIKPSGYLFITFPHLSLLRKAKIISHAYPELSTDQEPDGFYQFAFKHSIVQHDLEKLGFSLIHKRSIDGLKGLKEEVAILRPLLRTISHSSSLMARSISGALTTLAAPVSGHIMLLVMQKR